MRIFLLRALISWWFIPLITLTLIPVDYLFGGNMKKTVGLWKEISYNVWNGWPSE